MLHRVGAGLVVVLAVACQNRPPAQSSRPPGPRSDPAPAAASDPSPSRDDEAEAEAAYRREVETNADARDAESKPPSKAQIEWDRDHLPQLLAFFADLQCRRLATSTAGEAFVGGSMTEEEWSAHERTAAERDVAWQNDLFVRLSSAMASSHVIGWFLEGSEVVGRGLLYAYRDRDRAAIAEATMTWDVIETRMARYVTKLGGKLPEADARTCSAPAAR